MKKFVYIFLWIILGIIISILLHVLIEIFVLRFFINGLKWLQWIKIHNIGSVVLLILGILAGYFSGKYWWRVIYIEKKYKK